MTYYNKQLYVQVTHKLVYKRQNIFFTLGAYRMEVNTSIS